MKQTVNGSLTKLKQSILDAQAEIYLAEKEPVNHLFVSLPVWIAANYIFVTGKSRAFILTISDEGFPLELCPELDVGFVKIVFLATNEDTFPTAFIESTDGKLIVSINFEVDKNEGN